MLPTHTIKSGIPMQTEITERTFTISIGKAYAIVVGIVMGTAFVVIAYYGLEGKIEKVFTDLDKKIDAVASRVSVIEALQNKGR